MNKKDVIQSFRINVESEWQQYAAVEPRAFIALVGDEWLWIPLQVESDDPNSCVKAVQAITQSLKPSAVACAACGLGGDDRFTRPSSFQMTQSCTR